MDMTNSGLRPVPVVELIHPKDAEVMLGTMVTNRAVSEAKVFEYAISMDEGKWSLNGETLKFDVHGHLFDGQHRLRACVLAEKPFRTYVIRGIDDPRAFATVDVGKTRTTGDMFHIAGFASANEVSAATLVVYLFKNGKLNWRGPTNEASRSVRIKRPDNAIGKKMKAMPHRTVAVQKDVLLEYAGQNAEGLSSAVRAVNQLGVRKNKILPPGLGAALYFLFREKSFDEAEKFFKDLVDGTNLSPVDPVYLLRERLLLERAAQKKPNRWTTFGLSIKCWNKRREGEDLRHLKLGADEAYPKKVK